MCDRAERNSKRLRVSIVVPAHNEEENLRALLASLSALDFPREQLEIIVVDHDSSDGTRTIALQAGVQVLTVQGGTVSRVRNAGAAAALGDVLAFIDADCTVAKDWLSKALPHFNDCGVGVVGSRHIVPLTPPTWVRQVRRMLAENRPELAEVSWVPSGNMFVRRELFIKSGGFDESLTTCEDVDLCYRIGKTHRIIADKEIRCYHHGEPKTFAEMFRRELWRGRSNYVGVARHGLSLTELPSLLLPIYFSATLMLIVVSPLVATLRGVNLVPHLIWCGLAFLGPLLGLATLMSLQSGGLRYVLHYTIFYGLYFIARGVAPFYTWQHVGRQS